MITALSVVKRHPFRMLAGLSFALLMSGPAHPETTDQGNLLSDRTAIERVYHNHRTGAKRSFDEAMPRNLIDKLVALDARKEILLRRIYGVEVSDAMVAAEANRIDTTTRAPEILAEIKAALGNDPVRFARSMARPIVVERELRHHFENDDALHAEQRRLAENTRADLSAGNPVKGARILCWWLTRRPPAHESGRSMAEKPAAPAQATSSAYQVEATVQIAQAIGTPSDPADDKLYFEDLDFDLRKVLAAQLRKPGDVSAVIETPRVFLVFQAKETTAEKLVVRSFSVPKRSYEEWLSQQPD